MSLLLLAIGLAVLAKPSVIPPRLLHAVSDMAADSCLDCHHTAHEEWYPADYPLQPEATPQAAVSGLTLEETARLSELSDKTRAYLQDDIHSPMSLPPLEAASQMTPAAPGAMTMSDWLGNCVACHQPLRDTVMQPTE